MYATPNTARHGARSMQRVRWVVVVRGSGWLHLASSRDDAESAVPPEREISLLVVLQRTFGARADNSMRSTWARAVAKRSASSSSPKRKGMSPRSSNLVCVCSVVVLLEARHGGHRGERSSHHRRRSKPSRPARRPRIDSVNWSKTRNSPAAAGFSDRQLHAGQGVADIEKASRLAAAAVDGQRLASAA